MRSPRDLRAGLLVVAASLIGCQSSATGADAAAGRADGATMAPPDAASASDVGPDAADRPPELASPAPADAASAISCGGTYQDALAKTCTTANDCTLVHHDDCCGTVVTAIEVGSEAAFTRAESAYHACVPGCGQRGCFHADTSESGSVPTADEAIVADCQNGRCSAVVRRK